MDMHAGEYSILSCQLRDLIQLTTCGVETFSKSSERARSEVAQLNPVNADFLTRCEDVFCVSVRSCDAGRQHHDLEFVLARYACGDEQLYSRVLRLDVTTGSNCDIESLRTDALEYFAYLGNR